MRWKNIAVVFAVFYCIAIVNSVSAIDTKITVKTLPLHDVQLTTFDPDTTAFSAYESFRFMSDENGEVSFVFSSDKPSFGAIVFVKKDNVKVLSKKFPGPFTAGQEVTLEVLPEGYQPVKTLLSSNKESSNESSESLNNVTIESSVSEESSDNNGVDKEESVSTNNDNSDKTDKTAVEGYAVLSQSNTKATAKYLLEGAAATIIFLIIIGLIVVGIRRVSRAVKEQGKEKKIKVVKLSEKLAEIEEKKKDNTNNLIADIEERLKGIQEDIDRLKKMERMKELKEKIIENEKELIKLREEQNSK